MDSLAPHNTVPAVYKKQMKTIIRSAKQYLPFSCCLFVMLEYIAVVMCMVHEGSAYARVDARSDLLWI